MLTHPRTALVILLIIALLGGALACKLFHKPGTVAHGPTVAGGTVTTTTETDWSLWLSVAAGVLAAIETAIRTIMTLMSRKQPAVPEPPTDATKDPPVTPSG